MKLVILVLCMILILETFISAGDEKMETCDCDYKTVCKSSPEMSKMKKPGNERTRVAALGRVARLGDLYDARNDQFMGKSIYMSELPSDLISSIDISSSSVDYVKTESVCEKFGKLGVQLPLAISFLGGLVNVSGSGNYLNQDKQSAKGAKTSLVYSVKTIREDLKIIPDFQGRLQDIKASNIIDTFSLKNVDATHVVVGIEWGASVVLSLEDTNTDPNNNKDAQRKLEDALGEIVLSVSNSSHVDRKTFNVEKTNTFSVQLNTDILPNSVPHTIKESIALMKNIPDLIKTQNDGKGIILKYILEPIKLARSAFDAESNHTGIVSEMDTEIICQFLKIFQEIKDSELLIKDVYNSLNTFNLTVPKNELTEISNFKKTFFSFGNMFRKRFANLAVLFRSGKSYDGALSKLIPEYEGSNYTLARVKNFLYGYRPTMHKIELLNSVRTFNVSFILPETKNETTEKSHKEEIRFSADFSNVSAPFANDLIALIKVEFEKRETATINNIEDVPIELSEIRIYVEGKITKSLPCDEKLSPFRNITEKIDKKEYIFLKDYNGTVMIVDGDTLKKIRDYNWREIAKSLVAIVNNTFYNIDTMEGLIKSTAVENIMNESNAVNWAHVGSFPDESEPMYSGVAVNNSFIYFVTLSGVLYLYDTSKTVTKIGAITNRDAYASLVIVDNILYIHRGTQLYSFDGTGIKEINTSETRRLNGLFRLGSLVCRVGGNYPFINPDPVSCYNPSDETWTVISYINHCRYGFPITSTKSGTYVFGGYSGDGKSDDYLLNSVEVFNPNTKIWSYVPSPLNNKTLLVQAVTFYL